LTPFLKDKKKIYWKIDEINEDLSKIKNVTFKDLDKQMKFNNQLISFILEKKDKVGSI
jgi:hypothetical protein